MRTMNLLGALALTLLLALSGCSKQFQCHLSGTNCPASAAPAGGGGGGEESSESSEGSGSSEEQPASESSSESGESGAAPAEEKDKDCLPSGVKTDNYHKCCSEAAKSQIEASEDIYTCA